MKITRRKTVAFTLEQDGFSLHTFEISHVLNWKSYQSIMDYLKVRADNWYRCKNGTAVARSRTSSFPKMYSR